MLDKLLAKWDEFLNNNKRSTHYIALIAGFLFTAYFTSTDFKNEVNALYAMLPAAAARVVGLIVGLLMLYHNGKKPPTDPEQPPAAHA